MAPEEEMGEEDDGRVALPPVAPAPAPAVGAGIRRV